MEPNDHRLVAARQDLLHFQEEAPGMAFWHPRGLALHRLLEEAARRRVRADGYLEVRTPQLLREPIWRASGHWQSFGADMFRVEEGGGARSALKPVSCPAHAQLFARMAPSYRDLPIRLAEFGLVHRDEPGGALHGLFRLRQFTQDDGHVFCAEAQAHGEIVRFCRSLLAFYAALGLPAPAVALSTRPAERAGDDATWDRAEALLGQAAREAGLDPTLQPGAGAFYGPKLELALADAAGRSWQCGTIQLDFVLPERFDLSYVAAGGERRRPVMLHRALFGSLERFLGILLERHAGRLPAWLAPVQARVLAVSPAAEAWAGEVRAALERAGLRADADGRDEALARRVARAHEDAVPFVLVVGEREREARAVALRAPGGQRSLGLEEAVRELAPACAPPA